jgi:hypothetical protein
LIEPEDYFKLLHSDLPFQFRDKEKISGLLRVLAKQLNDAQKFLADLNAYRAVDTAAGVQLDGIGNIVCLSRVDALALTVNATVMDDDAYRKWLKYKIAINTANGTYADLRNAIKMLLGDAKVGYQETPESPATAILNVSDLDYKELLTIDLLGKIKAAGVRLDFNIHSEFQEELFYGLGAHVSGTLDVTLETPGDARVPLSIGTGVSVTGTLNIFSEEVI